MIKVSHLENHAGNKVIDQFIITTDKGRYLSSYNTIIAFKPYFGTTLISSDYKYSTTTGKYRNLFLKEKLVDTERHIQNGEYILVDKILVE